MATKLLAKGHNILSLAKHSQIHFKSLSSVNATLNKTLYQRPFCTKTEPESSPNPDNKNEGANENEASNPEQEQGQDQEQIPDPKRWLKRVCVMSTMNHLQIPLFVVIK